MASAAMPIVVDLDPDFTFFTALPIELRIKVWEHAFPARVVNLIYDQYADRFHTFNSTTPTLLHIHRESRVMGLKIYQLSFGTESFEPRIYFDFKRDILLFDDYLQFVALQAATQHSHLYKAPVPYPEYPIEEKEKHQIERIAINADAFWDPAKHSSDNQYLTNWTLEKVARPVTENYPALREMNFVIESVNPFSRAPIRLFNIGSDKCSPICDICYDAASCQDHIEQLKKAHDKKLSVRLVGGYRGSVRFDLGCYSKVVERDPNDDRPPTLEHDCVPEVFEVTDEDSGPFSIDSDDEELDKDREKYLEADLYTQYEYDDANDNDELFSDHEVPEDADFIPEEEIQDLRNDENLYRDLCGTRAYREMQSEFVHPEYYAVRESL